MTAFFSEALGKYDRSAFTSGNERIDNYFRQTISQDVKRSYAAGFVLVDKASAKIAGFYTLSSHSIPLTDLPVEVIRKLPRYPSIPAVLIGWLGRDAGFRGQHIGPMPSRAWRRRRSAYMRYVRTQLMTRRLRSIANINFGHSAAVRKVSTCR